MITVNDFRETLRGALIQPHDKGYHEARAVWNGTIDRHPAVIATCAGSADVIAAVNFARELNLEIAVRGSGHNVAGTAVCDDGIVIDLSAMRAVWVDPRARTALVPGQDVRFVVVDDGARLPERVRLPFEEIEEYDVEIYSRELVRAAESIVSPLGWDRENIRRYLQETVDATLQAYE